MKLCPLFEKVMADSVYGEHEPEYRGAVRHCNEVLPREAIAAAIEEVEYSAEVTLSESRQKYLAKVVKQLRAML
jgi:hypothetical protein